MSRYSQTPTMLESARAYVQDVAAPLSETLGLKAAPAYADTIALSFLFFLAIHLVVAPIFSSLFFPEFYGKAGRRARNNWSIHVVSLVHAVIIVTLALQCLNIPSLDQDRAFGWDESAARVHAIACGKSNLQIFSLDTLDAVINFIDIRYVLHGLTCLTIFLLSFKPFLAYYGPRSLLWELSTIPLNIHWFLDKTGHTGSTLQLLNGIVLLSTFFGARLVYGAILSVDFFQTMYSVRDEIPKSYLVVTVLANILLQALSWIWFAQMIPAVRKRFSGSPSQTNGVSEKANSDGKVH